MNLEKFVISVFIISLFGIIGLLFRNDKFGSSFKPNNMDFRTFEIYKKLKIYKYVSWIFFSEMLLFIFLLIIDFNIKPEYCSILGLIPVIVFGILIALKCALYGKR